MVTNGNCVTAYNNLSLHEVIMIRHETEKHLYTSKHQKMKPN